MAVDGYVSELITPDPADVAGWRAQRRDGQLVAEGPCPHCAHECLEEIRERVQLGGAPSGAGADPQVEDVVRRFLCNCEKAHPDRPDGVLSGCGRFWMAGLVADGPNTWKLRPFTNTRLSPALAALAADQASEDARMRDAAEKWLTGIAAICALFSIAGVATAKDATVGLSQGSKVVVAVPFLAAVVCAAAALVTAYTAAYGWPHSVDVLSADDVRDWYARRRSAAGRAATRLRSAVVLACLSLATLALVMMLLWFLPRAAPTTAPRPGAPTPTPSAVAPS
jgi:hypothetical protein